ncbi:hypothetical protein AMTRI_Chr06g198750 [Amborella trichopoda]|nr:probable 2-oxoglutarate-dependent dioxygenase AOP1 [Amborella trichopoda]|eukprot:XP_006830649.2 probable 2-oxoglutarate-dependent dioxygenase AOP1 [Amborella trichopoda]
MGYASVMTIPVLNFSGDLKPGTERWRTLARAVRQALEGIGCFEAVYDTVVPESLQKEMFSAMKELFELPQETKVKNRSEYPLRGYLVPYPRAPLYEATCIDHVDQSENVEQFTNLMWPQGNSKFSETVKTITKKATELNKMIQVMIWESYGVEKYFNDLDTFTNYNVRMMRYKAPKGDEKMDALNVHTDKNMVTLLYQDQVGGLELQSKDGSWIPVLPSGNSFVVMIGDVFMALSNGRLHPVTHRVMLKGREDRYSYGLFSVPTHHVIVDAPEALVDEDHPKVFKPFDYTEFFNKYFLNLRNQKEYGLKEFAGI